MNPIDDLPISTSGAYNFASDPSLAPLPESSETGPLDSRLASSLWKTKANALTEVKELVERQEEGRYRELIPTVVGLVKDANMSVSEAAVEVVGMMVKARVEAVQQYLDLLVPWIVEKGVTSPKIGLRTASMELLLDLYERVMDVNPVVGRIVAALDNKVPKVQTAALMILTSILKTFGAVMFPMEEGLKASVRFAASTNAQLRTESLSFLTEAYRWSRDSVLPLLDSLKKTQSDELRTSFQSMIPNPAPLRFPKRPISASVSMTVHKEKAPAELPPIRDIFEKYDESWVESVLNLEKWTLKKEALEGLNREIESIQIAEKSPSALVTLIKRCLKDANLHVNIQGIRLAGLLAKGQGPYFEPFARQILPGILGKIRDKKANIVSEVQTALHHFTACMKLGAMAEDFGIIFGEKIAGAKVNLMEFVGKEVDKMAEKEAKTAWGAFGGFVKGLMEDSTAEVRKAAVSLAALLLTKGNEPIESSLAGLPGQKIKEVQECISPGSEPLPPTLPPTLPPAKPVPSRPNPTGPSLTTGKKSAVRCSTDQAEGLISTEQIPDEAIEGVINEFLPETVRNLIDGGNWKEKQSGFQEFAGWVRDNRETTQQHLSAILRYVTVKCKNWKENNLNVLKAAFELIETVVSEGQLDWRTSEGLISQSILQKITDPKLTDLLFRITSHVCAKLGPKRVVSVLCKETTECTKPKVVAETCEMVGRVIQEFGTRGIDLITVVNYAKKMMGETNTAVKKAAHGLIVTAYQHSGESLIPLLSGLNKHIYDPLIDDLKSVEVHTGHIYKATDVEEQVQKPIEKANIAGKINRAILQKMNSGDWKERKEALDALETTLGEVRGGLSAAGLSDLVQILRIRISDPNKTLQKGFLSIVGKLGELLGGEGKGYAKTLLTAVINSLTDKQQGIRQTALGVLDKWAKIADADTILSLCSQSLMQDNADLRQDLLPWLLTAKDFLKKANVQVLLPPLLQCLQDRVIGIRSAAELIFAEIVDLLPVDVLENALKDLKPTIVNSLQPVLNKYRKCEGKKVGKTQVVVRVEEKRNAYVPVALGSWMGLMRDEQSAAYLSEAAAVLPPELSSKFIDIEGSVTFCAMQVRGLLKTAGPYSYHSLVLKWLRMLWVRKARVDLVTLKGVLEAIATLYSETHVSMLDPEASIISPFLSVDISPHDLPIFEVMIDILTRVCVPPLLYNGTVSSLLEEIHPGFQSAAWVRPLVGKGLQGMANTIEGERLAKLYEIAPTIGREIILETYHAAGDLFWSLLASTPDPFKLQIQRLIDSTRPPPISLKPRKSVTFMDPVLTSSTPGPLINDLLAVINDGSLGDKVDALSHLCEIVGKGEEDRFEAVIDRKMEVIRTFEGLFKGMLKAGNVPVVFARFSVKILAKICSEKRFSQRLSVPDLSALTDLFLTCMLHDTIQGQDPSSPDTLLTLLNLAFVLLMENSDPTSMFSALFDQIRKYATESVNPKLSAALIRSVLKLTRVMDALLPQLDLPQLLLSMFRLIEAVPRPASSSLAADDSVAKMVKTVIYEVVKLRKVGVWEDYNRVKNEMGEDRNIARWIGTFLNTMGVETPSVYRHVRSPLKARANLDSLTLIFDRVRTESSYNDGIKELFDYTTKHPDCELTEFTRNCSEELTARISTDLEKMKQGGKGEGEKSQLRNRMDLIRVRFGLGEGENAQGRTSVISLKEKWENIKATKNNPQP